VAPDEVAVEPADPRGPEAQALIEELTAELERRYDDDGSGGFDPADVLGPRGVFLVGRLNGRAVACGACRPLDGDVGEVKRMYVAPEARGRGLGRLILNGLEEFARRTGYQAIWLETGVLQPEAVGLYESAGYQRIPNYGQYKDDPRSVCFEKRLV
jgi:GNAT superfamily N-acetyltransferase